MVRITDAKGNTVSETTYNSLNLAKTVTDAAGKTTTYTYNELGKVETVTDALNNRQQYTYNARGQQLQVIDADGHATSAAYDILGNITHLFGPLGGRTEYTYDNLGRLIAETTTSGGKITYGYNALHLREEITNARGQSRKYFYDALGRVTNAVSAEDTVQYTYDANGNVLTVTDKNGTITRTYDALNRVSTYTDTYGNTVRYAYDSVGNLAGFTYPDGTAVSYEYDAVGNLTTVTDWAGRTTTYTYDENNHVIGAVKPDGSTTTTAYDNAQRVVSHVERTASGTVITGFEYTYDDLSRIVEEKVLAKNTKLCYTYDDLNRVTKRITIDLSTNAETVENYSYDAAGNIHDEGTAYDTNNRLTLHNYQTVAYDEDGNMTCAGNLYCTYDSANRLTSAGGQTYTYNAENTRIRNVNGLYDTTYVYNTNARLSQLMLKNTNGIVTKYVYGLGLIGEEKLGNFKTYHFDYRGSTVAITDVYGNITDTFEYDTYGKLLNHTGDSFVIFGYNGRDGVITDSNGLIYMRARYYAPQLKRFVNADIVSGELSNAVTLNRYAYANGNPVSLVDPFGLSAERGYGPSVLEAAYMADHIYDAEDEDCNLDLPAKYNGWKLRYIQKNSEGLKFGVYYKDVDGTTSYSFVFAGSEPDIFKDFEGFYNDWVKNNFTQPFGKSRDMQDAIQYARGFVGTNPNSPITFVGHSKGGAEAVASAIATKKDAILFNPAIPNYEKYDLDGLGYTGSMVSYVIEGEALSAAYDVLPWLPVVASVAGVKNPIISGMMAYVNFHVFMSPSIGSVEPLPNPPGNIIKDHSMESVIYALSEKGYT